MESYYQYRLLQDGHQIGEIENTSRLLEEWSSILDRFEGRYDGVLTLQRRFITDYDPLWWELYETTERLGIEKNRRLHIKNMVICPWETAAEFTTRSKNIILIGG